MRRAFIASIACFAWAGTALAEPPPGGYQETQPVQYYDPNQPPPPQQQQYYDPNAPQQQQQVQQYDQYGQPVQPYPQQQPVAQPAPVEQTAEMGRGLQYGGTLFVPIFVSAVRDGFYPGIGIHGRIGWELAGGLSLEGGIGAQFNPDRDYYGDLTDVFFTGGIRYAFLNPSALVPFLHAEAMVNLWNYCDDFGCTDYSAVTGGFGAGGGLIWEINRDAALEMGVNVAVSSPGDAFYDWQVWLSPFIGITLYY